MEVYITNLDAQTTDKQLHALLEPYLKQFQINVFEASKRAGGTVAWLTIADYQKASRFVNLTNSSLLINPSGRPAGVRVSNKVANPQLLRILQKEEKDLLEGPARRKLRKEGVKAPSTRQQDKDQLLILVLDCGSWETMNTGSNNIYQSYYHHQGTGIVSRRGRDIVIALHKPIRMEIHIDASTVTSVVFQTVRNMHQAVITVALTPTILEHITPDLLSMLKQQRYTYSRSDCLLGSETHITGSCLAYCLSVDSSLPALTFTRCLRSIA